MPDAQPTTTTPTTTPAPGAGATPPDPKAAAPAAAAPAAQPPKPDPLSPRFAALAADTKKLAQEKQALSAERKRAQEELQRERAAFAAEKAEAENFKKQRAAFKNDPEAFFRATLGDEWYDVATQIRLAGGKPPADMQVSALREEHKAELEKLRAEQEERWKKDEERRQAEANAAKEAAEAEKRANIEAFETECVDFVKSNAEKYELINLNEVWGYVPQVIRETFKRTGKLLQAAEAADLVEQKLEELEEKKIQTSKKLADKWAKKSTKPPESQAPDAPARTLTNDAGATPRTGSIGVTSDDRYARAAAAYEATLAAERARLEKKS